MDKSTISTIKRDLDKFASALKDCVKVMEETISIPLEAKNMDELNSIMASQAQDYSNALRKAKSTLASHKRGEHPSKGTPVKIGGGS